MDLEKKLTFGQIDLKKATEYAGEDADVTLRLYDLFKERVDQEKLNMIYDSLEKPMVKLLSKNGIKRYKNRSVLS